LRDLFFEHFNRNFKLGIFLNKTIGSGLNLLRNDIFPITIAQEFQFLLEDIVFGGLFVAHIFEHLD
jgi:hypothetical protein